MSTASSEQQVSRLWDRCLSTWLVNTGVGAGIGIVLSTLLFRRRLGPVLFMSGFGMGTAHAQCQFDFAHPDLIRERLVKLPPGQIPTTVTTSVIEPTTAAVVESIRQTINED